MAGEAVGEQALAGVGVGLPGIVQGNAATWVPNVPYVVGEALAADLEDALGAPVHLANDAQTALLGEARYGAARAVQSAALFSIGTGVGGAILLGNRVLRGAHGAAGSFGWINVSGAEPHDPEHGQLELLASGQALNLLAREDGRYPDAKALVAAARSGDREAVSQLGQVGWLLGSAVATVASALDPEVVLLTGGVSEAFEPLEPSLREALSALASPTARTIPVRRAALGSRAGAWGAVALAAEGEGAFL
jgi:glucokinase